MQMANKHFVQNPSLPWKGRLTQVRKANETHVGVDALEIHLLGT